MSTDTYSDLCEKEIRLLRLLPVNEGLTDDICIVLYHACLSPRNVQSQWQARLRSKIELREHLPDGWAMFINPKGRHFHASGYDVQYEHPNAAVDTPLDESWRRVDKQRTRDDPLHVTYFEHVPTGQIINSDPRVLPGILRSRGVKWRLSD
jgi:hypothetical protein